MKYGFLLLTLLILACDSEDNNSVISGCPELEFSRQENFLIADFEGIDELQWYGWYINGVHIENEGIDDRYDNDNKYNLTSLEPGTYYICAKTETTNCKEGASFCMDVIIKDTTDNL